MIQMKLNDVAAILDAPIDLAQKDIRFNGISIDTRTLAPTNLFVALKGATVDGHVFIEQANSAGASAALVIERMPSSLPQLVVKDTMLALGQLSAHWRNQFDIPFIAVTGSNGKTTLKNMIASILKMACDQDDSKVLATIGTLNNHLGLPLTLARLNPSHRYAVIEMGMNHFGEIEYLTKMTRPHVAVITNAASAHLEGLNNLEGVAQAKSEIFLGLQPGGTAILNRDDAFYSFWREKIGDHAYLTFGFHPDADITASVNDQTDIDLKTPVGNLKIKLPLLGRHNILNMLAAVAATLAVDIELDAIKAGIEILKPAPGRLQMHTLANGVNIIDDSYNANPVSLQAAVETLSQFVGKKILVLGDMKELGQEAQFLHQTAGEKIRSAGIDYLFTLGELSANTALSFGEGAYHFIEQDKLVHALKPLLLNQTTVLIKGSRSMRMEKVVAELMQSK